MARRFMVSDTLGSGTRLDPYRAVAASLLKALGDSGSGTRQWTTGAAGQSFLFMEASALSLTSIAADSRVEVLPVVVRLARWDSWGTALLRAALLNRLEARGYNLSGIANATLFGIVLRRLGQRHEPAFDESRWPDAGD